MYRICMLFLFTPTLLFAQLNLVVHNIDLKINTGTDFIVNEGGVYQNNAVIANNGNIYLDNDWSTIGVGAIYNGVGWLWFNGTNDQTLFSNSPLTLANLGVDNGQHLVMGTDIDIAQQLNLTNGKIELNSYDLAIQAGASISNYSAHNFVLSNGTGTLKQQVATSSSVVFPIGSQSTSYTPATLTNSGLTDDFLVRVHDKVFENGTSGAFLTGNVVDKTWLIDDASTGSDVEVLLQWNTADELGTFNRNNCAVSRHISGSLWDNPPYTEFSSANPVGTAFEQSRAGFTSFAPFIVRDLIIILSDDLLHFEAKRTNNTSVLLDWALKSNTELNGFEIQRMLENQIHFETIGYVDADGIQTIDAEFQYNDPNNFGGISYYRLKQINQDGQTRYSDIRAVRGIKSGPANYFEILTYPNPAQDYLIIECKNIPQNLHDVRYSILNVNGQKLFESRQNLTKTPVIQLDCIKKLTAATYMIAIDLSNGQRISRKFIKL